MFFLPFVVPLAVGGGAPGGAPSQTSTTISPQTTLAPASQSSPPPPPPPAPSQTTRESSDTTRDPATQQLLPIDPTTGKPLRVDPETGLLIVPRDPTTGLPVELVDQTGQPLVIRDETGQEVPTDKPLLVRPDSLLRNSGGLSPDLAEQGTRGNATGGRAYRARLGLVEGFTSNALETQATTNGPITIRPGVFTGLDGSIELHQWTSETDSQTFRIGGRLQHYIPLDGYSQLDDGTLNGSYSGSFTLGKRTIATASVLGTLTSSNSALVSDGPLFQVDPSTLTRVYTLENARVTISHELSPSWRVVGAVDAWMGTTVSQAPIVSTVGPPIEHRGIDYVTPGGDLSFNHDLGPSDIGSIIARYNASYVGFVVDYTRVPPAYVGKAWNQSGTLLASWAHGFTEHLRLTLGAGASLAEAAPIDVDQRPIFSPTGNALLFYRRGYWLAIANASYSYGSANPRLGFGPSAGGGFTLQGIPYPYGKGNNFSVLATASASRSTFIQGETTSTVLVNVAGSLEGRYALNNWLGIVGGYNGRYTDFEGVGALAPFLQHILFLGVSGYFANDRSLPTLESFAIAINPPG